MGFPGGSVGKESACNVGDLGSILGLETSPGGGHGNPLQYSCLENPWTEEPGGLQSMGSHRVRHVGATEHAAHTRPVVNTSNPVPFPLSSPPLCQVQAAVTVLSAIENK